MEIKQKIEIDLAARGVAETLQAVQGDKNSRTVEITLTENGNQIEIPAGTTGVVKYRRQDGVGGSYDTAPDSSEAVSFSGNTVSVKIAEEVLAVDGNAAVTVALVNGEQTVHVFVFWFDVQKNPGMNALPSGGAYLAGTVPDSGWTPNAYLGTNDEGKVVAKAAPDGSGGIVTDEQVAAAVERYLAENPVEPGATAEQAAQIQANTDALEALEATVESVAITEEEQKWTLALSLDDGSVETTVVETDADCYPTKITVNGREIPVTVTVVSEGETDGT